MTAATLPTGYTLTDDGGPIAPDHRYSLHRDGRRVGMIYRDGPGRYTVQGWHYLHALDRHGPGQDAPHRQMTAGTVEGAAVMLAHYADTLARLAADLAPYRDTAAAWHGGQSSAFYALASSGAVVEPWQLAREAATADREAFDAATGDDLPADAYALAAIHALATAAAHTLDSLTDGGPA